MTDDMGYAAMTGVESSMGVVHRVHPDRAKTKMSFVVQTLRFIPTPAALPVEEWTRLADDFERIEGRRGLTFGRSGDSLVFAYFPTRCVFGPFSIAHDGSASEVAMAGRDGVVGISPAGCMRKEYRPQAATLRREADRGLISQTDPVGAVLIGIIFLKVGHFCVAVTAKLVCLPEFAAFIGVVPESGSTQAREILPMATNWRRAVCTKNRSRCGR